MTVRRSGSPTRVELQIRNESSRKRIYRRLDLQALAEQICTEEGMGPRAEVSVLFCDDAFIATLNKDYRHEDHATDVLSFPQPDLPAGDTVLLGDIVISLETVERRCEGDRSAMREEVRLLFCHGLLHLLGYDHETAPARDDMNARQARYLGVPLDAAWKQ
jgi:probable rRNA maturation factor